jgi:hypothetical protein
MNKKQKILTVIMLPIFIFVGLFCLGPLESIAGAFTGWFFIGVIYAAIFFLLKPSRN